MRKLNELAALGETIINEAWAKLVIEENVQTKLDTLEEVDHLRPQEAFFLGLSIAHFLNSNENKTVSNEILDHAMLKAGLVDVNDFLN